MHSVSGESRSSSSSSSSSSSDSDRDVEQAQLLPKVDEKADDDVEQAASPPPPQKRRSFQFLIWTAINTLATIAIIFTNKAIFSDPDLRRNQSSFAAFHFVITGATLYFFSKPPASMFTPVRASMADIMPMAFAMCLNVILPNLSLAYSTVTFYQIARVLVTPAVALINLVFYGTSIPQQACYALIPICLGVGFVTYYETSAGSSSGVESTTSMGVFFAFSGVIASSLYTVWISTFQKKLGLNSMQLLLNAAPSSAFLLLYFIPFTDTAPEWTLVKMNAYVLILLSGMFASLINISQFFIVAGAGPVSSTVVGHLKTCSIIALGWTFSGRKVTDKGILGILVAIGGIIAYSVIMYKHKAKQEAKA